MKQPNIPYWAITLLMAAFMLMASIPDVLRIPAAIGVFSHLGYPIYLLPFLGAAKILGVIAVLVPAFQRLKEWAYAGLVFDLTGLSIPTFLSVILQAIGYQRLSGCFWWLGHMVSIGKN